MCILCITIVCICSVVPLCIYRLCLCCTIVTLKYQYAYSIHILTLPLSLPRQVDHHLFPMVPRHNLKQVHILVESFCKEHNVTYHETDMWSGTCEVLSHLSTVSIEFAKEFPAM